MGIFDFFKKKDKEEWIEVYSPLNGKVIPLSEIPDEAFSQKMIGDGCGIIPTIGNICSPINAKIDIFSTNHAISFETKKGLELLVHFGIDTVKLDGKGFQRVVENNIEVKTGEVLMEYDLTYIMKNAKSINTPIIITNMEEVEKIEIVATGEVKVGDLLMKVKLKN